MSVVLITGPATGMGNLSAQALAKDGHTVYAPRPDRNGRNRAHAEELLDRIPMHRVEFGKGVNVKCSAAGQAKKAHSSLLRTVSGPLVFVAHPGPRE